MMSDCCDPGICGQYRVVPCVDGKFQVEIYGWHDDDADFPYWGQFVKPFGSQVKAESYILKEVAKKEKLKRDREEAMAQKARFEAENPPYVFPAP
ncbi:hypothetical protein [Mesorhizobium sp. M1B.F.Ca.ET.045.04.1.1]|uniref:hypothetical protein n=1 Tax=Mesorhizobium sp. M1B.F.Ca.ET.045.04.1.1 TaxID=2493673 RepID=UPI000F757B0B|nr:hypothetical protein [Mesorhizobium sp. M1B.F.Ca.ET.045.04.1.1]AZO29396.1 hypothetical protein EJ071_19715 [Mesorhizobium sp. M1B.F.Ca.ET.045.04.1.1]